MFIEMPEFATSQLESVLTIEEAQIIPAIGWLCLDVDYTVLESSRYDTEGYRRILDIARIIRYNEISADFRPPDTPEEGEAIYKQVMSQVDSEFIDPADFTLLDRDDQDKGLEHNLRSYFQHLKHKSITSSIFYKLDKQNSVYGSVSFMLPSFYKLDMVDREGRLSGASRHALYGVKLADSSEGPLYSPLGLRPRVEPEDYYESSLPHIEFPEVINHVLSSVPNEMRDGAPELIRYLKHQGIPFGFETNGPQDLAERHLIDELVHRHNIYRNFAEMPPVEGIRDSSDKRKPDPELIYRVRDALIRAGIEIDGSDTGAVVGDKVESDVIAALRADKIPILIERTPDQPKYEVGINERLHELVNPEDARKVIYVRSPRELGQLVCRANGLSEYPY